MAGINLLHTHTRTYADTPSFYHTHADPPCQFHTPTHTHTRTRTRTHTTTHAHTHTHLQTQDGGSKPCRSHTYTHTLEWRRQPGPSSQHFSRISSCQSRSQKSSAWLPKCPQVSSLYTGKTLIHDNLWVSFDFIGLFVGLFYIYPKCPQVSSLYTRKTLIYDNSKCITTFTTHNRHMVARNPRTSNCQSRSKLVGVLHFCSTKS